MSKLQRLIHFTFQQICVNDDPNMYAEVLDPDYPHHHDHRHDNPDSEPSTPCDICDCSECTTAMLHYISLYAIEASKR